MAVESGIIPEPKGLGEDRMIREERWADIHHARAVERWTVSRIAREFDLDRKTVRECLRQPVWKPYTREVRSDTLLTKHADFLKERAPEVHEVQARPAAHCITSRHAAPAARLAGSQLVGCASDAARRGGEGRGGNLEGSLAFGGCSPSGYN